MFILFIPLLNLITIYGIWTNKKKEEISNNKEINELELNLRNEPKLDENHRKSL
jgi:hypothetical protein